ncbi:MAG: 4Fe-4S dicluster domain-containing protein, partial [Planctomycetota bacterium]
DRSKFLIERVAEEETVRGWDEFQAGASARMRQFRQSAGRGLSILCEATTSPTLHALRQRLLQEFPEARWHEYDVTGSDNPRKGAELALGRPLRAHYALDQAAVIVSLDCDFLGVHPAAVRYTHDFAAGRDVRGGEMGRLYAVEGVVSLTGVAADHRLPIRISEIPLFLSLLRHEVASLQPGGGAGPRPAAPDAVQRFAKAAAQDLVAHAGRSLVCLGAQHEARWHAAAYHLNAQLDNLGKTIYFTRNSDTEPAATLEELVSDLRGGAVDTLFILGGNPVYDAPADYNFAEALGGAAASFHLNDYRDETSLRCTWHLPRAHWLETWADARSWDGTYSVAQPMIAPLYAGRSAVEVVAMLLGLEQMAGGEIVRAQFRDMTGRDQLTRRWRQLVHDGFLADSAWTREEVRADELLPLEGLEPPKPADGVELVFRPDAKTFDGRFANNGWLQELPEPITRLTWDNAAVLSPQTAEQLGIADGTLVKVEHGGQRIELPAMYLPGMAEGVVGLSLGYGRTAAGKVGGSFIDQVPMVGTSVYPLRTSAAREIAAGASVVPTGRPYTLACVQDHFALDAIGKEGEEERLPETVREGTLAEYVEDPAFAEHMVHHPPLESLWTEHDFPGRKWAMVVDLSRCTGCGACVVACQAENNIPVVGKDRVLVGREMHWLRIDRYFRGDANDPQFSLQPVMCQQCELAPCEAVCPVNATVHSAEGLNDMVYNRCVGTRYCANNCPYKVRRFNFFNYRTEYQDPKYEVRKMGNNPEVTIRSRGVMEKCTYCVQRIQAAKIEAKNARRSIRDGEIQTACQQACPARAIVFGDLSDPVSAVSKLFANPRAYALLGQLNTKPRTEYLARIRNPNPELAPPSAGHDQHGGHKHQVRQSKQEGADH